MRDKHRPITSSILLLAATTAAAAGQVAQLPPPLEVRVPRPPTTATAEGGSYLIYELHVTSFSAQPMVLKRVDVVAGEGAERRVLAALEDSVLARAIGRPGLSLPFAERSRLAPGTRAVVYLWVGLQGPAPARVRHQLRVEQGTGDSTRVQDLEVASTPVANESPAMGAPLPGGVWLTANGPAPDAGHRRGLLAVAGLATIAQRFAIDYVKVEADGRTHTGDPLRNENYHAYGVEVLSVADGVVAAVKDGIPENVPGPTSRAVPITLETVGGNHVIVDIGGGRYAFYAHLQPGSLRVREGDRVRGGQVLGLVGNSGNSTEPHLHFHVSDGPSPLGSEGLPYRHESFELVGRCASFVQCERVPAEVRRGELPLGNRLVRFPD